MPVTADTYLPFDSGAGADVAEAGWRGMARHWRPSGPLITDLAPADWDVLQPSAGTGRQVLVEAGSAWIAGHYGEWDAQSALDITANTSGSTRVDAIVARVDFVNNTIELDVVEGTPGAGLPALTQDTSEWEILLGSSTLLDDGTTVTVADLRTCVGSSSGTYTPVVRNNTTEGTISAGSSTIRYSRLDDRVTVEAFLVFSAFTGTGTFTMSLPTDAEPLRTSAHNYVGLGYTISSLALTQQYLVRVSDGTPDRVNFVEVYEGSSAATPLLSNMVTTLQVSMSFTYTAAH